MDIKALLSKAIEQNASDIFVVSHLPITFKIKGNFVNVEEGLLSGERIDQMISAIYELAGNRSREIFDKTGDDDFSFSVPGLGRFRANTFKQRGSYAAVIRVIMFELPDAASLSIPSSVMNLANLSHGLVLVTGPAGSGKSTTLACIIDQINKNRSGHIITMEDPIEYIHRHKKCIVSQREVPSDTNSYVTALRAALRQSPNVLLLGEMRDLETIEIAMTAAETGLLVFSTLHTVNAANTIDRIIDVFPTSQQRQIRIQLAMVLKAVVSQQLLPCKDGGQVPAFEVMLVNLAIQNMIRDEKVHQIDSAIYSGTKDGMITMDNSLINLYRTAQITKEEAIVHSTNYELMQNKLDGLK